MERVAKATGARTQTTVNGLTAESAKSFLGTCKRFEEQQVCVCVERQRMESVNSALATECPSVLDCDKHSSPTGWRRAL